MVSTLHSIVTVRRESDAVGTSAVDRFSPRVYEAWGAEVVEWEGVAATAGVYPIFPMALGKSITLSNYP